MCSIHFTISAEAPIDVLSDVCMGLADLQNISFGARLETLANFKKIKLLKYFFFQADYSGKA